MDICVIGTGYVGLVSGTCFAGFGVNVTCVDKDADKIERLKRAEIPIFEPGLEEIVKTNTEAGRLVFTTELAESVKKALVIFIAVGTPQASDGSADMTYIKEAAKSIAANLNGYKVIVTKSTVPVGTGKLIEGIIREGSAEGTEFNVVSNPEFLREGSAVEDFMRPNRVVLGTESPRAIEILKDLYSPLYLIETPFVVTNIETAELIKYASNAFLATKVSYINELANICELVGADIHMVAKGMGLDNRIGRKFLHPGPGYGGSCFPKDTRAITEIARGYDYTFRIVEAAIEVNELQHAHMIDKIKSLTGDDLSGVAVGVLGVTFKPNTDDIRDSPAARVIELLLGEGASVKLYDPAGMDNARGELSSAINYCSDSYEVAEGSDILVLLTEWNQFRKLDMVRIKKLLKSPKIADLRNVYEPEQMKAMGFEYISVGR